uniref:Uncharacterized protein n=1 Tax=Anguilla anguilla TaxID=7936 RepID=A0A0E9RQX5_ANGAN
MSLCMETVSQYRSRYQDQRSPAVVRNCIHQGSAHCFQ